MQSGLEEMSIWSLISGASLLVQIVMIILVLASLFSWYLIILRSKNIAQTERKNSQFLEQFRHVNDLQQLTMQNTNSHTLPPRHLQAVFNSGYQEYLTLTAMDDVDHTLVNEGVERAMLVAIGEEEAQLEKGLSFLATVGSVSPYIGLFGTVWGIMNAFIGLSQVQQATLSTVAPGIAEALIATAIGLFAAIPAVIAYNRLSARASTITSRYYVFGNELQMRLHRIKQKTQKQLA